MLTFVIKYKMYQNNRVEVKSMSNENNMNINWYKPTYGKLPMKAYK